MRYQRSDILINQIINSEKDLSKELFSIEKEILEQDLPNIWNTNVAGNMEKEIEVEFFKYAHSVLENSNLDLSKMSVFEFYTKVEQLMDKQPKK